MNHIISPLLAKANCMAAVGDAAGTLAKGVVRWAAWAAPRLAAAVEALMVGVAGKAAWNAFEVVAALGSFTTGLVRWLETAGRRRSK